MPTLQGLGIYYALNEIKLTVVLLQETPNTIKFMDKDKRKINMLSPEEMQKESVSSNPHDYWDEKFAVEACAGKGQFAICEWRDLEDKRHVGYCQYEMSHPRRELICVEFGSGTTDTSGSDSSGSYWL